jgi:ZIP family zinc transporter
LGLLAGAALPLGALAALFLKLPQRAVAGVMAFGAGTLIAALTLVLMEDARRYGSLWAAVVSFLAGALAYTIVDTLIRRYLGRRRRHAARAEQSGLAIAAGSLIDNIPEGIVIGIAVVGAGTASPALLAAVFLSNFPEALASAARMKEAGHGAAYILGIRKRRCRNCRWARSTRATSLPIFTPCDEATWRSYRRSARRRRLRVCRDLRYLGDRPASRADLLAP